MELETYQRKLAGLIKGTYSPEPNDDAHLKSIAKSENLLVTQEIITWWRQLCIERYCQLTSAALKQLGIFEIETERMVNQWEFSSYIEELGHQFLVKMQNHELELVACLAKFESALINVKQGIVDSVTVEWQHAPYAVLSRVVTGSGLHTIKPTGYYETLVSRDLPGLFKVLQINRTSIDIDPAIDP